MNAELEEEDDEEEEALAECEGRGGLKSLLLLLPLLLLGDARLLSLSLWKCAPTELTDISQTHTFLQKGENR